MGGEHNITAVEINPKIAECYKKLFPNDTVIVGDCHEYLREHFREFDFIWLSPPCPTHSVLQMTRYYDENLKYPDMALYQEILLLKHFFKGKWVIENVIPYYEPLIPYTFKVDRHIFWSSDFIMLPQFKDNYTSLRDNVQSMADAYGYDINILKSCNVECRLVLRNTVVPEIGKNIFDKLTEAIMDKVIIDGVDVSECKHFGFDSMELCKINFDNNYFSNGIPCAEKCSNHSNCYYKQLQRARAEIEELKAENDNLRKIMWESRCPHYVLSECSREHHNNCVGMARCIEDLEFANNKYSQCLKEIKEIAEKMYNTIDEDIERDFYIKLQDKISECIGVE